MTLIASIITFSKKKILEKKYITLDPRLGTLQPRPQGFSLKKWVGQSKALASAGHVSPRTP